MRPGNAVSPALPVAPQDNHVSVDEEGYAISKDGLLAFFSDEYGPYIYVHERRTGFIVATIAPPAAITPMKEAKLNFTSETTPDTGRAGNQGFEGLTLDRNTNTLWALLQSSTIQDSVGGSKTTNRYSRLFGYNVDNPFKPKLISEYVVPLPQSSKKNTRAASELHVVDSTTCESAEYFFSSLAYQHEAELMSFLLAVLVLARDGNGFGDTSSDSTFKQADLISTKGATNIANTAFDTPSKPVAPNGVLDPSVTPVQYTSFINLIERPQLAKFGLQVGGAFDSTLVAGKLESLAVGPLPDKSGNQLLFVVSDNDFITTKGYQAAEKANGRYVVEPYSDPYAEQYGDASTQIYIYNVTLPGYSQGSSPY